MGDELFLGLDIGISTVKVALFTGEGELVALESDEYMVMPEGDVVEADPEIYWAPMARSIRKLLKNWGGDPQRIAAASISSHGETVFPMRRDGKPARKALNWMDNRSQLEAQELVSTLGSQLVLEITGQPEIGPIWPVTKYRWMCKHEPEVVEQTASFLLPEDYILFRLSGQFAGEYTLWSSSVVFDIRRKSLSDELLSFAGISAAQIPSLYPAGTAFGNISPACAAETGLSTKTRVVTGALDQVCAAIGAGNVAPGMITESTGSVLALVASIREPIFDDKTKLPCHIHAVPETYCMLPWNPTGGMTLKWFKDSFAPDLVRLAQEEGKDVYDLLSGPAESIPPGSDGLIMLPHLEGAFFPEFDAHVRAVFFGFTLSHTRAHFTRAIMEAIAYMLRDLEGLQKLGVDAGELRVLGGGAKSRLWSQIKADICNIPVIMPSHREAAVMGAAMLAAVGVGYYPDIPAAAKVMAHPGTRLEPDPANRTRYDASFELYVSIYDALKPLFPRRTEILKM
jgi:sugar (pentulose or hexulose) kinase